jgi:hypothetical protein
VGGLGEGEMEPWAIAILIKPIALLIFFGFIVLPIKLLFQRIIPDGRIKRLLFKRL